ncbi:MAG: hypothetical protein H7A49_10140 [Akkermansiaceae bacterium]|nr:hypothetical protein [Akkermansiaceae bacterium]MCP5544252.1 hypothetical protein [Akkermansiaceae bacterium]MCP5547024.1 hypothetical protein [Akkermansiaceae bacterium]
MPLLEPLRSSTQPLRQRLDESSRPDEICGSRERFVTWLEAFDSALVRCWPWMDWRRLSKLGLNDSDRRELRYVFLREELLAWGGLPRSLPSPHGADGAEAVGAAYALESLLDTARALHERAEAVFGPPQDGERKFPTIMREDSEELRDRLHRWLESLDADDEFAYRACAAACQTFEVFLAALGTD